jgi:hypothetical protein
MSGNSFHSRAPKDLPVVIVPVSSPATSRFNSPCPLLNKSLPSHPRNLSGATHAHPLCLVCVLGGISTEGGPPGWC